MSGLKTFAIIGAGNIGAPIAEAFLAAKAAGQADQVLVLTRPESASSDAVKALAAKGARIVPVEYTDTSALTSALKGVDAIISTLGFAALQLQVPIAKAAHTAGVRLFAPSEFGVATDKFEGSIFAAKEKIAEEIRAVGLPTTLFFTGGFADWVWVPSLDLDIKSGKVSVGGDGNAKLSFTSRTDIARFVAYALTRFSLEQLQNKALRIEAERSSFNEVFRAYEGKSGKKLEVTYISIEELKKRIEANAQDIRAILHLLWAEGKGSVGEPLDNEKWPEWKPSKVIDYL